MMDGNCPKKRKKGIGKRMYESCNDFSIQQPRYHWVIDYKSVLDRQTKDIDLY